MTAWAGLAGKKVGSGKSLDAGEREPGDGRSRGGGVVGKLIQARGRV